MARVIRTNTIKALIIAMDGNENGRMYTNGPMCAYGTDGYVTYVLKDHGLSQEKSELFCRNIKMIDPKVSKTKITRSGYIHVMYGTRADGTPAVKF